MESIDCVERESEERNETRREKEESGGRGRAKVETKTSFFRQRKFGVLINSDGEN